MRRFIPAVLACLLLVTIIAAAPILPGNTGLSPEVKSLAGIRKVEVLVQGASSLVNDEAFINELQQTITQLVTDAGLEVTQGVDLPRLNVVLITNVSSAYPDAVSYTYHLSLEQNVRIERLDQTLFLPTYALVHGELTSRDQLQTDVKRVLPVVINHFLSRVAAANR